MDTSIHDLMQKAQGKSEEALRAREKARELLGLDDPNWTYYFYLYQGWASGAKGRSIRIHEPEKSSPTEGWTAYPISIAPKELLKSLEVVDYADLKKSPEHYDRAAGEVALWVKKMHAGTGSSLTRTTYLSRQLGIPESEVKIGAKGTDLRVDVPDPRHPEKRVPVSIAEAQILQCIESVKRGELRQAIFHDIVSSETEESIQALWDKPSLVDPKKTYRQLVEEAPGLGYFGVSRQSFIPTIDETGKISFNRKAPGGHALFAVDALRAAYQDELRPKTRGKLIAAISNGEDLSSSPDAFMLGYMAKHRAPIVLVTTERTAVDLKGGLLSLLIDEEKNVSLTVLETAQAAAAGQAELFASLPGMVSTNLTLFNYDVLAPLISREVEQIGEDEFLKIVAPDVITNPKEQRDADGATRKYTQLEGAMGSTITKLDRYWRKKYGKALVHLINVDRMHRTEFFSPIKSAFDYFMLFHSDRFELDPKTLRLKNLRPGELPRISVGKLYQDVESVLEAFGGARIRDLDELIVEGPVKARGAELRGKVKLPG